MGRLKQPDRFEKIVNKVPGPRGQGLTRWEAMDLLRAEHRAVVRMVKREAASLNPTLSKEDWGKGYMQACMDILVALAERAT